MTARSRRCAQLGDNYSAELGEARQCITYVLLHLSLHLLEVLLEHKAVADVTLRHTLNRLGAVLHVNELDPGLNVLLGRELEHREGFDLRANVTGAKESTLARKVLHTELDLVLRHTDRDNTALSLEHAQECSEVNGSSRCGVDDDVERLGLELVGPLVIIASRDKLGSTHLERVVTLRARVRDGNNLGTKGLGKQNAEVAETTNANNGDALAWADIAAHQWAVQRQTSAKHRGGMLRGNGVRDREHELLVSTDRVRVTTLGDAAIRPERVVSVDHVALAVTDTVILVVMLAGVAVHARANLRTDTNAVANLDVLDILANLRDNADNLMAGNHCRYLERAPGRLVIHAPAARDGVYVRTTDTTVGDLHLNIVVLGLLEVEVNDLEVGPVLSVVDSVSLGHYVVCVVSCDSIYFNTVCPCHVRPMRPICFVRCTNYVIIEMLLRGAVRKPNVHARRKRASCLMTGKKIPDAPLQHRVDSKMRIRE